MLVPIVLLLKRQKNNRSSFPYPSPTTNVIDINIHVVDIIDPSSPT